MPSSLPLSGLVVVELGTSVAAPTGAQILAELGAEVVKVENPRGGDDARAWGPPFVDGVAAVFRAINRNKRSAGIDLNDAAQREALRRFIIERADIVLQNLRAGVVEKFGLDAASLRALKPSLIYCNLAAFGATGPLRDRARIRSVDAGVRRHHERHRRGRTAAGARRPLDRRSGRRHVGGDRHPRGAASPRR